MTAASQDVAPPRAGPPFLRLAAWPYRLEMAGATLALLVILLVWRLFLVGDLHIGLTIFWFVWPDLAAFVPIGLAFARTRAWPAWGSALYNATHTFLVWGAVFLLWTGLVGGIEWPLLGWAAHITADRAAGYYLRAPPT